MHAVLGFVWAVGITFVIFTIAKRFMKIRVSPEAEIEGVDMSEFGALCYPDFVLATTQTGGHAPEPLPPLSTSGPAATAAEATSTEARGPE